MPRKPRRPSNTGIYHVMIRGNEKKDIFADDKDKKKLVKVLKNTKAEGACNIFAFCIMNNHAHFVMEESGKDISNIMKSINTCYAAYYNRKHDRVGHVFQDRFKSEPVENERYLLQVIRYVHNNPVKAEVVSKPEDYLWSSYRQYIDSDRMQDDFISMEPVLELYGKNKVSAITKLIDFTRGNDEKEFLDVHDGDAKSREMHRAIEDFLNSNKIDRDNLKNDLQIRNKLILMLREEYGFSIRSIEKEMGINRNIIQRVSILNESKRTVPNDSEEEQM